MIEGGSNVSSITVTKDTINRAIYCNVPKPFPRESVCNAKNKIFILGGRGQIGRRTVRELVKELLLSGTELQNKTIEIVLSARSGSVMLESIVEGIKAFLPTWHKNIKFICVDSDANHNEYIKQMSESDMIINAAGMQLGAEQEERLRNAGVLGREGMIIVNYAIAEQLGRDVAECDKKRPKTRLVLSVTNQTDAFNIATKLANDRTMGNKKTATIFIGVSGLVDDVRLKMLLLFENYKINGRSMTGSHDSNMFLPKKDGDGESIKTTEKQVREMGSKISADKSAGKKTHEGATILPSVSIADFVVKVLNGESVVASFCTFINDEGSAEKYGVLKGSPASAPTIFDGQKMAEGGDMIKLESIQELSPEEKEMMRQSQVGVCRCATIGVCAFYMAKLFKIHKKYQEATHRLTGIINEEQMDAIEKNALIETNEVVKDMECVGEDLKRLFGESLFEESQKSLSEEMEDAIIEVVAQLTIDERRI
jgi:hypothetical protein